MTLYSFPEFERFTFKPLELKQAIVHFATYSPEIIQPQAGEAFNVWLLQFIRKAKRFYSSQYRRYERTVLASFRHHYKIPEGDAPEEYGYEDEWKNWCLAASLKDNFELVEADIDKIDSLRLYVKDPGENEQSLPTDLESLQKHIERRFLASKLDSLWFNITIQNSDKMQQELRSLPYPLYLHTPHWRRIRAAMLLIHGARCNEETCYATGDSWYGGDWETDLHVHHLDYSNLGNERFDDLTLLCSIHHRQWHENMDKFGDPQIQLADRD